MDVDGISALGAAFVDRAGRAPAGVWSAPGRVNLIGEHTDYSDGYVLPLALQLRTRVAVAPRRDGVVELWSLQLPNQAVTTTLTTAADEMPTWAAYVVGVARAMPRADAGGFDVVVDSDVPVGAGLSSSAALTTAVALALDDIAGSGLTRLELARVAQRAEDDFVGVPCGLMDQIAALFGQAGHAVFVDTRTLDVEHVAFAPESQGLTLLVIDSRVRHSLADGEYKTRRDEVQLAAEHLGVRALRDISTADLGTALTRLDDATLRKRVRHVVTENRRVRDTVEALRAGRIGDIGPLLNASHASLRDDFEVSHPNVDAIVEAAIAGGSLGARMTGAGFGGSVVALTPAHRVDDVTLAVRTAVGDPAPTVLRAESGDGARRER